MSDVTPIRPGSDEAPTSSAEIVARNRLLQRQPDPSPQDLRETIEEIDRLSQRGFGQVAAMAHLARKALETAGGSQRRLERVLEALEFLAEDTMDSINIDAEAVGCNFKSER